MIDPQSFITTWAMVVDHVDQIDAKLQLVQPQLLAEELLQLRTRLDHLLQLLRT